MIYVFTRRIGPSPLFRSSNGTRSATRSGTTAPGAVQVHINLDQVIHPSPALDLEKGHNRIDSSTRHSYAKDHHVVRREGKSGIDRNVLDISTNATTPSSHHLSWDSKVAESEMSPGRSLAYPMHPYAAARLSTDDNSEVSTPDRDGQEKYNKGQW